MFVISTCVTLYVLVDITVVGLTEIPWYYYIDMLQICGRFYLKLCRVSCIQVVQLYVGIAR